MKNLIVGWKTTLLGIIILSVDFYYLLEKNAELTPFIILLVAGIAMLFAPDTLIGGVKTLINKNKSKQL
jgi:hypothetical protein